MPWPTTAMFTGRPFTGYWERCDADEPPLLVLHGYGRGLEKLVQGLLPIIQPGSCGGISQMTDPSFPGGFR